MSKGFRDSSQTNLFWNGTTWIDGVREVWVEWLGDPVPGCDGEMTVEFALPSKLVGFEHGDGLDLLWAWEGRRDDPSSQKLVARVERCQVVSKETGPLLAHSPDDVEVLFARMTVRGRLTMGEPE